MHAERDKPVPERSADWMAQAKRDLESARAQLRDGFHEWACFISQQAAEKAIKAAYQKLGGEAWGHSLVDLLRGLEGVGVHPPPELKEACRALDLIYVPSRYPNGWAGGSPFQNLGGEDAERSIAHSQRILGFCQGFLAG